jgi:hypothetical protein
VHVCVDVVLCKLYVSVVLLVVVYSVDMNVTLSIVVSVAVGIVQCWLYGI